MRVARYMGGGKVEIVPEEEPSMTAGGLLVRTEACGLCSGELMDWYMDRKVPHVLGHEVCGIVTHSADERFPVGSRVFPHHHAPCLKCDECLRGEPVHCRQWKSTRLSPGGMADLFAVSRENLTDTLRVDDMRPVDAALIEPLACVVKSIRLAGMDKASGPSAVIGLGVMGLMHLLLLGTSAFGVDLSHSRIDWARGIGLDARSPDDSGEEGANRVDTVFVCPGSQAAFDSGLRLLRPGGTLVLFAPLPPGVSLQVPQEAYFHDVKIVHSYSCGPEDTRQAAEAIREGRLRAEQVCSEFVSLDELPDRYLAMKRGEILKPMVVWPGAETK